MAAAEHQLEKRIVSENIEDVNVQTIEPLLSPAELKAMLPLTSRASKTVAMGRRTIRRILSGEDPRLLLVVGPCSIHDVHAAWDYAQRLKALADETQDCLFIVMRAYFEKPRTCMGWKGLINDPHLDDSFQIATGLQQARQLLRQLAELGLPVGTEALDPIVPQYLADLISWAAIGARTTESQTHRELASGLSMPVGVKNGTDGNLESAVHALVTMRHPHAFLGITQDGRCAVVRTKGNPHAHIVLRGGNRPNYDSVSIALAERTVARAGLEPRFLIDCAHGNSAKDPQLQPLVAEDVVNQILDGNRSILGLMLESNLGWGAQKLLKNPAQLEYGVSITDPCIDWPTTQNVVRMLRHAVRTAMPGRASGW